MDQPSPGVTPPPLPQPQPPVTPEPPQFDADQIYPQNNQNKQDSIALAEASLKSDYPHPKRHMLIGVYLIACYMIFYSFYFLWLYHKETNTLPVFILVIYGFQLLLGLGLLGKWDIARRITVILEAIGLVLNASSVLGSTAVNSTVRSSQIVGLVLTLVVIIYLSLPSVKSYFY